MGRNSATPCTKPRKAAINVVKEITSLKICVYTIILYYHKSCPNSSGLVKKGPAGPKSRNSVENRSQNMYNQVTGPTFSRRSITWRDTYEP